MFNDTSILKIANTVHKNTSKQRGKITNVSITDQEAVTINKLIQCKQYN